MIPFFGEYFYHALVVTRPNRPDCFSKLWPKVSPVKIYIAIYSEYNCTHCTCIKLYKLPLDQKTGLQKNRYKTPMKSLPPFFFPSQTSSVSKERVNQVLVRKIFDVESEFQCTDLSTRTVVYNPSKFTTSHSKKKIYPGTLSRSQSL